MPHKLQSILSTLPEKPGVYQYYDKDGKLLYIGKAKSLKKRVSSYFHKEHDNGKTAVLVSKIADIKVILVDTEMDALLLENNLIKKYQPHYNVNLRDDKTYPWICVKKENFPRVFYTRKLIRDGSEYFGPYTSVKMIQTLLDLINQLFQLRSCSLNLSQENIEKKKFKVCLEYHIGNCKGPCEALQTAEDYDNTVQQIRFILKGNLHLVIHHLKEEMEAFAAQFKYEDAQEVKEKLVLLEKYKSKSVVVNPNITDVDVFGLVIHEETAYVNFLKVINGAFIQSHIVEMKKKLDETDEELLELAIADIRTKFPSESKEIIVPVPMQIEMEGVEFTVPKIGDKKHLLALAEKNLKYYINEKQLQFEKQNPENRTLRLLEKMQKDLRLKELPRHIECFDNSNIQGAYPVAAMSVFRNGSSVMDAAVRKGTAPTKAWPETP